MPNRTSRNQRKPKSQRSKSLALAGPAVWAPNKSGTELKNYVQTSGNFQLYHNVPAVFYNNSNLLNLIVPGPAYYERIGQKIHVKSFVANLVLNNKTDRPNVSYRIMFFAAPATVSTDTAAELLSGGGFTGIPHYQNAECLYDTCFPMNQGSSMENNMTPNKERSFNHRVSFPLNHSVVYNTDGNCSTRLVGFVTSYDAFGTLTTDNIASVAQLSWRIAFTDV
jgi:hypothetical protein